MRIDISEHLDFDTFTTLVDDLVVKVGDVPDIMVCLSTGGFVVGAVLAKRLGMESTQLIGLPALSARNGEPGRLDTTWVGLKGRWEGVNVLVVDDAVDGGTLMEAVTGQFKLAGAHARGCVLVANSKGIRPDVTAALCDGPPPPGWWEV